MAKTVGKISLWRRFFSVVLDIIKFPFYFLDDVWDFLQVSGGQLANGFLSLVIGGVCYCGMALLEANRHWRKLSKLLNEKLAPLRSLRMAMHSYLVLLCLPVFGCGLVMFLKLALPELISSLLYGVANIAGSGILLAMSLFSLMVNAERHGEAKLSLERAKQNLLDAVSEEEPWERQKTMSTSNRLMNSLLLLPNPVKGSSESDSDKSTLRVRALDLANDDAQKQKKRENISEIKKQYEAQRTKIWEYREKITCNSLEIIGYSLAFIGFLTGCVPLVVVGVSIGFMGKFVLPRLPAVIGLIEKCAQSLFKKPIKLEKNPIRRGLEKIFSFLNIYNEPSAESLILENKKRKNKMQNATNENKMQNATNENKMQNATNENKMQNATNENKMQNATNENKMQNVTNVCEKQVKIEVYEQTGRNNNGIKKTNEYRMENSLPIDIPLPNQKSKSIESSCRSLNGIQARFFYNERPISDSPAEIKYSQSW